MSLGDGEFCAPERLGLLIHWRREVFAAVSLSTMKPNDCRWRYPIRTDAVGASAADEEVERRF